MSLLCTRNNTNAKFYPDCSKLKIEKKGIKYSNKYVKKTSLELRYTFKITREFFFVIKFKK